MVTTSLEDDPCVYCLFFYNKYFLLKTHPFITSEKDKVLIAQRK